MKTIICEKGKFQELRHQLLEHTGEKIEIKTEDKNFGIIWKFEQETYDSYKPKTVTKDEYIKNMLEKEIHAIYQMLIYGGILTKVEGGVLPKACYVSKNLDIDIYSIDE